MLAKVQELREKVGYSLSLYVLNKYVGGKANHRFKALGGTRAAVRRCAASGYASSHRRMQHPAADHHI
jgi:hypothetical protein